MEMEEHEEQQAAAAAAAAAAASEAVGTGASVAALPAAPRGFFSFKVPCTLHTSQFINSLINSISLSYFTNSNLFC
jgi:hypothetical protein